MRRAADGEKLVTLDGQERILTPDMITIADPDHAVGLGGVMGGLETEVTGETVNVMLEAATFNGPSIRRTSKALGLRSACFTVVCQSGTFSFTTRGYGHGVGMSQWGAKALAEQGADYRAILAHYYPGTQLTWMDKTGFSGS